MASALLSGFIERLRGAPDWPKTASQCDSALARFEERRRELEDIVAQEEQKDLERSFANPRIKGSTALADATTELARLRRKIELVGQERTRLHQQEAEAELAAAWCACDQHAEVVRQHAARIDAIAKNVVSEILALYDEIGKFDSSVPKRGADWHPGVDLFNCLTLTLIAASEGTIPAGTRINAVELRKMHKATMTDQINEYIAVAQKARGSNLQVPAPAADQEDSSNGQPAI